MALPRIQLSVHCDCGFDITPLIAPSNPERANGEIGEHNHLFVRCDSCGQEIEVTDDDLREAQHSLLVALEEA
jgi:hypothetical protein